MACRVLALLAVLMLLGAALLWWRRARQAQPQPPTIVSPAVPGPTGQEAYVVRTERTHSGMGEGPIDFAWKLVVRGGGERTCRLTGGHDAEFHDLSGARAAFCYVGWERDDIIRVTAMMFANTYQYRAYLIGTELTMPSYNSPELADEPRALSADILARLGRIGSSADEIAELRFVPIEGQWYGGSGRDFISMRPDVLLVLGPDYGGHGAIIARGPVLLIGAADSMGPVASDRWVFLDDRARARDSVDAPQIYVADPHQARSRAWSPAVAPTLVPPATPP